MIDGPLELGVPAVDRDQSSDSRKESPDAQKFAYRMK